MSLHRVSSRSWAPLEEFPGFPRGLQTLLQFLVGADYWVAEVDSPHQELSISVKFINFGLIVFPMTGTFGKSRNYGRMPGGVKGTLKVKKGRGAYFFIGKGAFDEGDQSPALVRQTNRLRTTFSRILARFDTKLIVL
ncbi:hypothetical protein OUZ56_008958 [Daphnia magna]|uniref:Uncharacterized protein n=1 Tax=Daphnia magna TaxID=35525 RepID=A0ABR0AEL2_9CRUS|nr:hypothetical protein OUZ56_008958 [Daphnia magna]